MHLASRDCVESVTTQQHETAQSMCVLDTQATESAEPLHQRGADPKPPQEQSPPPERSSSPLAGSQVSRRSSCDTATPKSQALDSDVGGDHRQGDYKPG